MARRNQDEDDDDYFDPRELGFDYDEWDDLKEMLGYESDDEMLDAYPDMESWSDWMDELDYLDEIGILDLDEDFYG